MADSQLIPPFVGIVHTTRDALLLFEGARRSLVPRITRRLMESEKHLITSGAIFIFDELESGIQRWTDGLVWSPSRIMSNFVVYREANQRTDRRLKRARNGQPAFTTSSHASSSSSSSSPTSSQFQPYYPDEVDADGSDVDEIQEIDEEEIEAERRNGVVRRNPSSSTKKKSGNLPLEREEKEREIVGSLMPSSRYKTSGLIKKTISISINGVAQHLVSYFTLEEALLGTLKTPSSVPELASISIPPDLLQNQQLRFPPSEDFNEDGTLRISEGSAEPTPSSSRLPSTRRTNSAGRVLPALSSGDIIPVSPSLKRKRSCSLASTMELETSAEERRPNSFPLPSYASPSPTHLQPPFDTSPFIWNVCGLDSRRNVAFLSPMQEDVSSSIGSTLTTGSLQRTMASIDAYEIHGTHAGWKATEGSDDGVLEEKRKRKESLERDASLTMDWDPQQLLHQPSSSSSFSSSSTLDGPSSYYHLPYDHPSFQIHPPPPLLPPVRPLPSAQSYFPPTLHADHEHGGRYGTSKDLGGVTLGVEHEREEIVKWVGEGKEVGVDL